MTEPLFLCEVVWIVLWMVEWRLCLDRDTAQDARAAIRVQAWIAAALVAAIFNATTAGSLL